MKEERDIHESLGSEGQGHPNVLHFDSWFEDGEYYYYILELCRHQVRWPRRASPSCAALRSRRSVRTRRR